MAPALLCFTAFAGCILGVPGQARGYDYQRYIPGGEGGAGGQAGGFDHSKYMQGGGGGFDYSKYMQGGGAAADYSQYMGGGADYSQYMQGGGAGFNYSQYMGGGAQGGAPYGNYQQYMQGGGAGFNYSQYMGGGAQGGASYGNYQQYMQGGGAGFNYSQYMGGGAQGGASYGNYQQYMQGGGAGFNYSQYMGGGGGDGFDYSQYSNYSQYMSGGGGGFDYSQYMAMQNSNYSENMQGGGNASNSSQDVQGGNYSQSMQGQGDGFNYSQYMGGGGFDYSKYMPGGGGAGFDYSQYMGGGGFDYSHFIPGGGDGFNYSHYIPGGGASSGNYQQYVDMYAPGGGQRHQDERLAIAKADASNTLQQLKALLDQVSNASVGAEERDVRQHMLASLNDGERDAIARWDGMRQEFDDLHQHFQRDGANWSQEEKRTAACRAEYLDGNLTLLEEQLDNATGRIERYVSGFVRQRAQSDAAKADSLARLAGLQGLEWEGLARSCGNREEESSARDVRKTAQGLARDVGDAAKRLARSVEAHARRLEESARQSFRDDQARRRAAVAEMEPAEEEPPLGASDFAAAVATSASRSPMAPTLSTALMFLAPVLLTLYVVRARGRRAAAVQEVTEGHELPYMSMA